jgi:hypothetical protein
VASDAYDSQWIGGNNGDPASVGGPEELIVGVVGHLGTGNVHGVGTISVRARDRAAATRSTVWWS